MFSATSRATVLGGNVRGG